MLVNTIFLPFCCEAEGQIFLYKELNQKINPATDLF